MGNRSKKVLMLFITMITFLELYWGYRIHKEYAGIYNVAIFLILLGQPLWYFRVLSRGEGEKLNLRFVGLAITSVVIPIIIFVNLPDYTYNEGKGLIEEKFKTEGIVKFMQLSGERDSIPSDSNPKRLFVSNRIYYYNIELNGKNKWYIVNPLTGEIGEVEKDYWRETINEASEINLYEIKADVVYYVLNKEYFENDQKENPESSILTREYICYNGVKNQVFPYTDILVIEKVQNIKELREKAILHGEISLELMPLTIVSKDVLEEWKKQGYDGTASFWDESPELLTYDDILELEVKK